MYQCGHGLDWMQNARQKVSTPPTPSSRTTNFNAPCHDMLFTIRRQSELLRLSGIAQYIGQIVLPMDYSRSVQQIDNSRCLCYRKIMRRSVPTDLALRLILVLHGLPLSPLQYCGTGMKIPGSKAYSLNHMCE